MAKKIDKTERVLLKMFRENTGRAMCDSGDAYGRNYERNAKINLLKVASERIEFNTYRDDGKLDICFYKSSFQYCRDALCYEPDLDRSFHRFAAKPENVETGWLELVNQWIEKRFKGEAKGIYGEGDILVVNTYNEDSALDQVLLYTYFEVDSTGYYALQVHGGCDVRGGYTAPRIFRDNGELSLLSHNDGYMGCDNPDCEATWSTDDSYHWYSEGACGRDYVNLNDHWAIKCETEEQFEFLRNLPVMAEILQDTGAINERIKAVRNLVPWDSELRKEMDSIKVRASFIFIHDNKASCPCCGKGLLRV
jgi:hypothetical protein